MLFDDIDEFLRFVHQKIADATYWCFGWDAFALARISIYALMGYLGFVHLVSMYEAGFDWHLDAVGVTLGIDAFLTALFAVALWRLRKDKQAAIAALALDRPNPAIRDYEARRQRLLSVPIVFIGGLFIPAVFFEHATTLKSILFTIAVMTTFIVLASSSCFTGCKLPPPSARSRVLQTFFRTRSFQSVRARN